jgi:hypothetical protein
MQAYNLQGVNKSFYFSSSLNSKPKIPQGHELLIQALLKLLVLALLSPKDSS